MDIEAGRMEKIDLTNIKLLANDICVTYFSQEPDCEKKAEEAILEATNYVNEDPVKYFTTMAILPLRYYSKSKDVFETFLLNDNASIFSLDIIARFSEFPYENSLNQVTYQLCQELSKDPRRCIDNLGYLSFWHDIHMNTLTFRHKGAPIDDEFIYLLYFLMRNVMTQYIALNDIRITEKLKEIIDAYMKKVVEELKKIDQEKKKNKKGDKKEEKKK